MTNPTKQSYDTLNKAYEFFNRELFAGQLPYCLITLQRHKGALGYFAAERFKGGEHTTDEIALNPNHFERGAARVLGTLAHEMAHLWQKHFGKMPRKGYHDKQWAQKMEQIGLVPSDTAAPGGKKTGQKMSHYIAEGGPFAIACAAFLAQNEALLYQDQWAGVEKIAKARSAASKTKYTCPSCDANCWAKPCSSFICGNCEETMEEQE